MGPVREIFDLAKTKYERRVKIIKKKKQPNHKYTIVSNPLTVQIDQKSKMKDVIKGFIAAFDSFEKAEKTGQYLDFAEDILDHGAVAIKYVYTGLNTNSTPSIYDEYLLAFITIESQISYLHSKADLLLHKVNQMIEGVLNLDKGSVDYKLLSQPTLDKMVSKIDDYCYPTAKYAYGKNVDKDSIGVVKWISNTMLKISYLFPLIDRMDDVKKVKFDNLVDVFANGDTKKIITQGTQLIEDGKEILQKFDSEILNSEDSEIVQTFFISLDTFAMLLTAGFAAYKKFYIRGGAPNVNQNVANENIFPLGGMNAAAGNEPA